MREMLDRICKTYNRRPSGCEFTPLRGMIEETGKVASPVLVEFGSVHRYHATETA